VLDHGAAGRPGRARRTTSCGIDGSAAAQRRRFIGTDGAITAYLTTDYADVVQGDATLAYSTHSPYNNAGVPYPWSDWSWGLHGANTVEQAVRRVVAVHAPGAPPYFIAETTSARTARRITTTGAFISRRWEASSPVARRSW